LSKLRCKIDGSSTSHFENSPLQVEIDSSSRSGSRPLTPAGSQRPLTPKSQRGAGVGRTEFLAALSNRRATVDGEGMMYESKPEMPVADCCHANAVSSGAAVGAGHLQRAAGDDFNTVKSQWQSADCVNSDASRAMQQPSATRETGQIQIPSTFTPCSKPESTPAGNSGAAASVHKGSSHDVHFSASAAKTTECSASEDKEGMLQCTEAKACLGLHEDDASPGTEVTAVPVDQEQEMQEGVLEDDSSDDGSCTAAPSEFGDEQPVERGSLVKIHRDRVTWLIGLRGPAPLASVFESPPFAIGEHEGAYLRLRPCPSMDSGAPGCVLSLHSVSSRMAGLQMGLFAGKGWRKTALTQWSDDSDMEKRFNVDLSQRSSLLCGLVFRLKPGR